MHYRTIPHHRAQLVVVYESFSILGRHCNFLQFSKYLFENRQVLICFYVHQYKLTKLFRWLFSSDCIWYG